MTKPRIGRPPRADKASLERIELRVTRFERAAWEHAAAQVGVSLSEWIRWRCQAQVEAAAREQATGERFLADLATVKAAKR